MKRIFSSVAFIVLLFVLNLFCGSVHIPIADVVDVIMGNHHDTTLSFIILQHRLPQAVTALFAGAAISVAGLLLQTAFHNPLAGPSVLGISGGASLGVALVMLVGSALGMVSVGNVGLMACIAAFIGAMAVTALLLFLSSVLRNNLILLITGLLLGYLISAVITILNVVATPEGLQNYVLWGMGNFSSVSVSQLPVFTIVLGLLIGSCLLLIKPLNILLLGDDYARNLGVNLRLLRNALLLLVGGIIAVTTAFCGPVAFLGLAVPHIARMVCRTDNFRLLLPITILSGSAIALLCNLISIIPTGTVLPLNAVTPIVGIPVIIYVVLKRK